MLALPLQHTLRGLQFEPSAFSKTDFYVNVFFLPLCVPTKNLHLTFSRRIVRRCGWNIDQPDLPSALKAGMKRKLPLLTSLQDISAVADELRSFARPNRLGLINPHCYEALAYVLIESDKAPDARKVIDEALPRIDAAVKWQVDIASRMTLIRHKLLDSRMVALDQLSSWRTETISALGLGDLVD